MTSLGKESLTLSLQVKQLANLTEQYKTKSDADDRTVELLERQTEELKRATKKLKRAMLFEKIKLLLAGGGLVYLAAVL